MCLIRRIFVLTTFISMMTLSVPSFLFAERIPVLAWRDVERLLDTHPAWSAALGQVGVAEGELRTVKQFPNPELVMSAGESTELEGTGRRSIWDLELTIPLQWPGTYRNRVKAAKSGVDAARFDASATRLEVYRELRGLYLMIARDQENLRMFRESERHLAALAEAARVRVDHGEARPLELARLRGELEEFRVEIERADREAAARRGELNMWLASQLPREFLVEIDSTSVTPPPPLDETMARAATENPAALAARARQEQAARAISAEKHAVVPDLGIGAFYGEEFDTRNVGGLITVTVPLWNWNRGGIAKAKAEASRTAADADLTEKRIRASLLEAHARASASLGAAARYRSEIIPNMRRALGDLETLYRIGECGLVDVLDARRALVRAQSGFVTVQYDYLSAMLDMSVLTGGPDRE